MTTYRNPENMTHEEIIAHCLAIAQRDPRMEAAITLCEELQSRPDCTPQAGEWLDQVLAILTRPAKSEAMP
jgi:hypothetical protein